MVNVTKASKADPVEALRTEALARTNLSSTDLSIAAANVTTFIDGYSNQIVSLQNDVPFVDGDALLTGTDVSAPVVRSMLETLIREYSRVRLIRFVRMGDNFTYERFGRVNSPDSSTSDNELSDFGVIFPTNPIDQSEYLRVVAEAANVMRSNFTKLFAIIPYCHVSCHTDIPPPPPPPPQNPDPGGFNGDFGDDPGDAADAADDGGDDAADGGEAGGPY